MIRSHLCCSDNVVSPCTNWNKALQMTVWIVLAINMLMWHLNGPRAEKWASMQQCNTHPVPPATRLQYVCDGLQCFACFPTHTFLFIFVFIWLREKTNYSWKSATDHQSLASNRSLLLWILLSWKKGSGFFLVENSKLHHVSACSFSAYPIFAMKVWWLLGLAARGKDKLLKWMQYLTLPL